MSDSPVYIPKKRFNLRKLRLALKYRPVILRLILKLRSRIKEKHRQLLRLKLSVEDMVTSDFYQAYLKATHGCNRQDTTPKSAEIGVNTDEAYLKKSEGTFEKKIKKKTKNIGIQTEKLISDKTDIKSIEDKSENKVEDSGWSLNDNKETKSIAEQVAEVAQDALKESGMVYVESAGMYYDYKTGYYYNSELGLYYHTDTQCYYSYSEEKKCFEFHSYPDRSAANDALIAHEKRKAKKHKMEKEAEENNLKNPKRKKDLKKKKKETSEDKNKDDSSPEIIEKKIDVVTDDKETNEEKIEESVLKTAEPEEMEDGECSDTSSSSSDDDDDDDVKSNASTSTATDDESVAKHHPPCMRVIVRETKLPKLRVGNLFIITKDGGTVGREGEQHIILLKDHNVSRVVHGSTIQIGETKLLCHIHPGNDTCGHCEPGLLMEATEKEKKVAYTRTCSVQKQHQLELARLKNKSIAADNKGFKLLEKMGWNKGEGLGKDNQGGTEPVSRITSIFTYFTCLLTLRCDGGESHRID
ncbi:hypothetical protein HF086_006109 [Spodoptera exigua]|uniref:G-patch domain-containing protein n=1 Tax=Spodoptera exigua TaxID=7107 RepID=A0A922MVJ5_SPOEX|nr:hypothetical protein HF086_006109 [Spodoptera exigua]